MSSCRVKSAQATAVCATAENSQANPSLVMLMLGVLAMLAAVVTISSVSAGDVAVKGAWIREAPPVARVHAAYFEISNASGTPVQVTGVSSPAYRRAELHHSKEIDGVATMEKLAQIEVAPGKAVAFVPGGLHVMLFDPVTAKTLGDEVPLVLEMGDGGRLEVMAQVRKDASGHAGGHGAMHHGH